MTLLSWLPPFRNINPELEKTSPLARSESPPIEAMNPAHLAEKVAELCWELDRARDMCEQANLQFDRYRLEIVGLKRQLGLEKDACRQAHEIVFRESNHNTQLRGQVKTLQTGLRRETVLNSQLQARLNTESASLRAATRHSRTQEEKLIDTQLDLEYLRCTTGEEQPPSTIAISNDAPLPAQPFVVVLIDGDAYQWASDIALDDKFLGTGSTNNCDNSGPGATAASRVRSEVTRYILKQNGNIPITARIITRAFCNFAGKPGLATSFRRNGTGGMSLAEFAVQFTEKVPLFDFFDAGRGKERADDKIRENFHLFLSTPNCHAIFVAACLDNGFARMLEQYTDHSTARQKIVLVSPGYVALEIHKLGLKEIEWPTVFARRTPPANLVVKHEKEKKLRARVQRSISTPVMSGGAAAPNILPNLLDLVPTWNVNAAMSNASRGVGFRVPGRNVALESLDLAEVAESNEEVD